MEKKELKLAIRRMVDDVNICSRVMENAKKMGLTMMAQDYFSRIVGINKAMFYLGYTLEEDGRRADCGEGADPIEYMHYKEIKR